MKTTDKIDALVRTAVETAGYELLEVEFRKEAAGWVLTLYIDAPQGVSLDDCERVSRLADPILDEADPIAQRYYLSVSSPGVDRPLKQDRDYEKNLGKPITVKLYAPVEKKKEFTGTLTAFDEQEFTISLAKTGKQMTFARKDAASVKPYVSFEPSTEKTEE